VGYDEISKMWSVRDNIKEHEWPLEFYTYLIRYGSQRELKGRSLKKSVTTIYEDDKEKNIFTFVYNVIT